MVKKDLNFVFFFYWKEDVCLYFGGIREDKYDDFLYGTSFFDGVFLLIVLVFIVKKMV